MPSYRYLHYDVFTTQPLAGNQLAVLPDARGLDPETMQKIAREMAFSETTFVLPPARKDTLARVRIFTPGGELPMAGHPTIGTTFALVAERRVAPGTAQVVLGLGVGPTPVAVEWEGEAARFAWMTQQAPEFGATLGPADDLADALGVDPADVVTVVPTQVVSCGVPFVMLPLLSPEAVDRAELDRARWRALCARHGLAEQKAFVFAVDRAAAPMTVYSRMFAPVLGVAEDPGTGSASGPLGAWLVQHGVSAGERHAFLSRQGVKMQRPCEIHVRIAGRPGAIARVEVGGAAVRLGEGVIKI
jgi:trans-2,3-dihydro-3-hydroxyanthranilate isomerase